jgi:hypothetical protein
VLASVLGCNIPEVAEAGERKRKKKARRKTEVRT